MTASHAADEPDPFDGDFGDAADLIPAGPAPEPPDTSPLAPAHDPLFGASAVSDSAEVEAARAHAVAAHRTVLSAANKLSAAQDTLADREGAVRVAEAKAKAYQDDPRNAGWQTMAVTEQLATAERTRTRAADTVAQCDSAYLDAQELAAAAAADLEVAIATDADAQPVEPADGGDESAPPLYYGSTDEFVRDYLRHIYKRKIDGQNAFWSARWWTSDEAIARLEALWRSWEHLRLDPSTGPSVWWRDHADHHMRVLMSNTGPFSKEIDTRTSLFEPLPYEAPPEGLFPDVRDAL